MPSYLHSHFIFACQQCLLGEEGGFSFLFVSYQERIPSTKSVRDDFTTVFLDGKKISKIFLFLTFEIRKSAAHFSSEVLAKVLFSETC